MERFMFSLDHVALQLYSVRDAMQADFEGTIRRIAQAGYRAVEVASLPVSPETAAKLFDELDLAVSAIHAPLALGDDRQRVLDMCMALDCSYLVCAWLPADPNFKDADSIKRTCELLNQGNAVARSAGLTQFYHNHWWEAHVVDGKIAYEHMLDHLDPDVLLEIDTYWLQVGGVNPAEALRKLGDRARLVHLKDGPAAVEPAMTALGEGVIDIPAILESSSAEWYVVELDRCDTDMLEAVERSFTYLKGLA
jgi:sugar phosphate isomerase/epimerase